MAADGELVIGIDVGTGSARAGVFDLDGRMLAKAEHPIQLFRPREDHVEQSSRDIWAAVCAAVRDAVRDAEASPSSIAGLSFDATCSLVALDANDEPVTISLDGDPDHDIVVWMDHRAKDEADRINATRHRVLEYVGGAVSPEQEPPKLLWIKEHLPDTWRRTAKFLDLADFLVYRASGNDARSLCTVVCKWTYLGHEGEHGAWDPTFFEAIDLEDLFTGGRAGRTFVPMGTLAGGLTARAAAELGLAEGTPVGVGMIDAHAGGLGSLGMTADDDAGSVDGMERTLALIGGTSSCHMAVAREPRFVTGVWGPYFGAMVPGLWLAEGGQTATGALLDHVLRNHAAYAELERRAEIEGASVYDVLNRRLDVLEAELGSAARLTEDLHVLPDFHGNRSPRADSRARGAMSGLSLDASLDGLARLYLATIQAVAYGTRHIVEALNAGGYAIERIAACGGGTKNARWLREHADVTGCTVSIAPDVDAVLLGTAMLAAVAAGKFASIVDAMDAMSPNATTIVPDSSRAPFHDAKYAVFLRMFEDQRAYRRIMAVAG